jgi:hypothetical protein
MPYCESGAWQTKRSLSLSAKKREPDKPRRTQLSNCLIGPAGQLAQRPFWLSAVQRSALS